RAILPWVNRSGGTTRDLDRAVEALDAQGDAAWPHTSVSRDRPADGLPLSKLRAEHRLAVEMAANEEIERRALEGELAILAREWRDAEEVAQIADDPLTPSWLSERLAALVSNRA